MTRDPLATVAVVQRDRFSPTRAALERLYEVTEPPFRLIYVDGGSPQGVRGYLSDQARQRGFSLLRRDFYLSPNEARNLALHHVDTRYVVFLESLRRAPTELVEFHSMLVRREAFEQVGSLDELLLSTREHSDLCLRVRQAGGTVFLEPTSLVTYLAPPPVRLQDLSFFLRRWSDEWNWCSLPKVS